MGGARGSPRSRDRHPGPQARGPHHCGGAGRGVAGQVPVRPEAAADVGGDGRSCAHQGCARRCVASMQERRRRLGGARGAHGTGLRVLAVARRPITDGVVPSTPEDAEQSLGLTALLGLEDPPRSGAADAIEACRRAGIRAAMVTGDHPATALAIAEEVGLTLREGRAILGEALPADDEELARLVDDDGLVLARVAPEDKLRIARALRGGGTSWR